MRHFVTDKVTTYAIPNADGKLIYGTCPAGCNISTGQPVCETSIDGDSKFYDRITAKSVVWQVGVDSGTIPVSYGGNLYQPIQPHKTQADWTPDKAPALYKKIDKPDVGALYPDWKQPTGAHDAYQIGNRVMFNGKAYESKINANVWSPTGYPAGWMLLP